MIDIKKIIPQLYNTASTKVIILHSVCLGENAFVIRNGSCNSSSREEAAIIVLLMLQSM